VDCRIKRRMEERDPFTDIYKKEKCNHIVVDSGAFIKHIRIDLLGNILHTVPAVIAEVRDESARHFLNSFPVEIKSSEPDPADLAFVIQFARQTGDYSVLSSTDLKIIALTYGLERKVNGINHLRKEPVKGSLPYNNPTNRTGGTDTQLYNGEDNKITESVFGKDINQNSEFEQNEEEVEEILESSEEDEGEEREEQKIIDDTKTEGRPEVTSHKQIGMGNFEGDGEGWITTNNIDSVHFDVVKGSYENIAVGCLTTDFAMQNVLLQIGLNLISVDGMRIQRIKQFVLWCKACFKIHHELDRLFCSRCGHHTLRKITCSVDKTTGELKLHFDIKRLKNPAIRGTRFSLPKPKGGRKGKKLVLREDQLPVHRRRRQPDFFDPDHAFLQPRKPHQEEIKLGFGSARKNPNASKHLTGKKKKRNRKQGFRA